MCHFAGCAQVLCATDSHTQCFYHNQCDLSCIDCFKLYSDNGAQLNDAVHSAILYLTAEPTAGLTAKSLVAKKNNRF